MSLLLDSVSQLPLTAPTATEPNCPAVLSKPQNFLGSISAIFLSGMKIQMFGKFVCKRWPWCIACRPVVAHGYVKSSLELWEQIIAMATVSIQRISLPSQPASIGGLGRALDLQRSIFIGTNVHWRCLPLARLLAHNIFVQIEICISPNWKMYFSKLTNVFVQIEICIWTNLHWRCLPPTPSLAHKSSPTTEFCILYVWQMSQPNTGDLL